VFGMRVYDNVACRANFLMDRSGYVEGFILINMVATLVLYEGSNLSFQEIFSENLRCI